MPFYREDLEHRGCSFPGCTEAHPDCEIYFHALCHLDAPTWSRYRGDILTIECSVCRRHVASFVIASRESEPSVEPG